MKRKIQVTLVLWTQGWDRFGFLFLRWGCSPLLVTLSLLSKTQKPSRLRTQGFPLPNSCSLNVRMKLTGNVRDPCGSTREEEGDSASRRRAPCARESRDWWAEPGKAALLCRSEVEDLEFPGAFPEGGAEEEEVEEGRGEKWVSWLAGEDTRGVSKAVKKSQGGGEVARALVCVMFITFTKKLSSFRWCTPRPTNSAATSPCGCFEHLNWEVWCVKCTCMRATLLQSCPTLCRPMDCRPPCSSVHGILQARILEWVAMPSSRGSSQPRDRTHASCVSCAGRQFFTTGATWEARGLKAPRR